MLWIITYFFGDLPYLLESVCFSYISIVWKVNTGTFWAVFDLYPQNRLKVTWKLVSSMSLLNLEDDQNNVNIHLCTINVDSSCQSRVSCSIIRKKGCPCPLFCNSIRFVLATFSESIYKLLSILTLVMKFIKIFKCRQRKKIYQYSNKAKLKSFNSE